VLNGIQNSWVKSFASSSYIRPSGAFTVVGFVLNSELVLVATQFMFLVGHEMAGEEDRLEPLEPGF
jgi:hypothetical protein